MGKGSLSPEVAAHLERRSNWRLALTRPVVNKLDALPDDEAVVQISLYCAYWTGIVENMVAHGRKPEDYAWAVRKAEMLADYANSRGLYDRLHKLTVV